jgi:hypothetical protein
MVISLYNISNLVKYILRIWGVIVFEPNLLFFLKIVVGI